MTTASPLSSGRPTPATAATTPPSPRQAGGTATTTYVNGIGKTSYVYQYHDATPPSAPPAPGTASQSGTNGWDETGYAYTAAGQLATVTDADGNQWSYGYDLIGNRTSADDPDSGNSSSTYDGDGNLLSVTNTGTKTTTSYSYDQDNRKTAEYDTSGGASETGSDELASWTYDSLAAGQLTEAVAYVGGTSGTKYTESVAGYNSYGLPEGTTTTVSAGTWAGSYKELLSYSSYADEETEATFPAAGGLPSEEVDIGYDAGDEPNSLTSSLWPYVATLSYTELGQPQEYALGTTTEPAWIVDSYDQATGRLDSSEVQTGVSPVTVDDTAYSYDSAGLVTSEADTPADGPAQVQCFDYDYLGRLTQAWSQGPSGCSSGPSQPAESGAAAPYWERRLRRHRQPYLRHLHPSLRQRDHRQSAFPTAGDTAAGTTPPSPPHAATGTGPAGSAPTTTYD